MRNKFDFLNHEDSEGGEGARLWPLAVLAVVGFGPLLAQFFYNLWQYDTYQFFPLAIAGALFLAKRGLDELSHPCEPGSKLLTFPLVLLTLGLLGMASVAWSPWLGAASFLISLLTFSWWFGGFPLLAKLLPGWLVLITILPPPLNLDARFALLLQDWATAGSSYLLSLLGIPNSLSGLVVEIPGQRLLVEEACSGINSILFMTSACVFYAMWQRRGLFFLLLFYGLIIGCVLAGNLFRITSGAFLLFHYGIDLFVGWKHEALGLVLTATYLIFIVAADALLAVFLHPHGMVAALRSNNSREFLPAVYVQGGLRIVAIFFALFCAVQLVRGWDFNFRKEERRMVNPDWMDGSAKFTMPARLGGWELISEQNPVPKVAAFEDGVYSHIWQYRKNGIVATVSLDYPFFGYHDVTICYTNSGWKVGDTKLKRANPDNDMIPCMEVSLAREGGLLADLFYSTVDESGVWLEEPGERSPYDAEGTPLREGNLASRIQHRLRQMPFSSEINDKKLNYRIQVLAAARGGLGAEQRRQVEKLFQEARLYLADQFIQKRSTPTPTPTPDPLFNDRRNEADTDVSY